MECFIVEQRNVHEERSELLLEGDEAHHVKVLRVRTGERILATNLIGTCYECTIEELTTVAKRELRMRCRIERVLPNYGEPANRVSLIQGLLGQPARWEWLLEKATELGVQIIQPVTTERTERSTINISRSERVLMAAVKQTKRANKPWLKELSSLTEALSQAVTDGCELYLMHEAASLRTEADWLSVLRERHSKRIAVAIGPEGGFSEGEVERASKDFGAQVVSLGRRRLRAETAAIAALTLIVRDDPEV